MSRGYPNKDVAGRGCWKILEGALFISRVLVRHLHKNSEGEKQNLRAAQKAAAKLNPGSEKSSTASGCSAKKKKNPTSELQ